MNEKEHELDLFNRKTIEELPPAMMVLDPDGNIIIANRKMRSMVGVDIEGKMIFDIVDPSDITGLLEILKKKDVKEESVMQLHWNLEKEEVLSTLTNFGWISDGEQKMLVLTSLDPERGGTLGLPRSVLEELPFPVTMINRKFEVVFQNSAADEQISLVSKRKDPFSNPKKDLKQMLLQAFKNGTGGMVEVCVPLKDGKRSFDVTVAPIPSGREITEVMEIWTDTSTMDFEDEKSPIPNEVARELFENTNALILGIDMNGEIRIFNNGAQRVLGYKFEEVQGTIWFDYLLDKDGEQGKLEVFQWNIGSGFRTQYESRVRSASGEVKTLLLENTVMFGKDGDVSMVLMVGQDVTRTKKLEETLTEQREKLADAMEEITLYNDLMIHDIHNANAGILGYLELLQMENIDDKKKREFIDRALAEVMKSSSIIRDVKIMATCRPGSVLGPVELDQIVKRSIEKFGKMNGNSGIKIIWEKSELHVAADEMLEEAFIRIFDNLVANEGPARVDIRVKVKRDPARSNLIPDPVLIQIEDNRGGIPQDKLDSMLERPSTTELGSHMLGLYLVRKIITGYNGLVWPESLKKKTRVNMVLSEAV